MRGGWSVVCTEFACDRVALQADVNRERFPLAASLPNRLFLFRGDLESIGRISFATAIYLGQLPKYRTNRLATDVREEMAVSFSHGFRVVSEKFVNDSRVDSSGCHVRGK